MKLKYYIVIFLLLTPLEACANSKEAPAAASPLPTLPSWPTITSSPTTVSPDSFPPPTPTVLPTATPTPSPFQEIQSGELAFTYDTREWKRVSTPLDAYSPTLEHRQIEDCRIQLGYASDTHESPEQVLVNGLPYRFWPRWGLTQQGNLVSVLYGPLVNGVHPLGLRIESPILNPEPCVKAAAQVIANTHLANPVCPQAKKSSLHPSMTVYTTTEVVLRSAPRWSQETRIKVLRPGVKMRIVGGPICAIYNKGIYVYWQVDLAGGSKGWIAEGDNQEHYIKP